jgi:hypothetical protein
VAAYDAFISYSHGKDKPIAAALQAVVQKLGKPGIGGARCAFFGMTRACRQLRICGHP